MKLKGAGQRKLTFASHHQNGAGHHLKGAGVAWIFGMMMVVVVAVIFITGVVGHYDKEVSIITGTAAVYDTIHTSELIKRTLDGAAFADAEAAIKGLAANGGGAAAWTNETPTITELKGNLEAEIQNGMSAIAINSLSKRDVSWGQANVTVTAYDDGSFDFSGTRPFTVEWKGGTPEVSVDSEGIFQNTISTSYFKLLRLGRQAAVCPPAEGETTVEGFTQNVTNVTMAGAESYSYRINVTDPTGLSLIYVLDCA